MSLARIVNTATLQYFILSKISTCQRVSFKPAWANNIIVIHCQHCRCCLDSHDFLNQVHPDTFTLDLSLYIKLAWADNRIELANGSVNVDQSFMGLVRLEIHRFLIEFYNQAVDIKWLHQCGHHYDQRQTLPGVEAGHVYLGSQRSVACKTSPLIVSASKHSKWKYLFSYIPENIFINGYFHLYLSMPSC